MSTTTIERLTWVLIYGGLLLVGLGFALRSSDAVLAWVIGGAGGVAAAVGFALIWVRSRMKEPSPGESAAKTGAES